MLKHGILGLLNYGDMTGYEIREIFNKSLNFFWQAQSSQIYRELRTLEKNGQRVKLTQVEYGIVKLFMENPGKALSREEILDAVWGKDYFGELKIVDVNIRRLRIKIEDNPTKPTYVNTVWGYGYKWGS